jgi:hypothetical protein
MRKKSQIFDLKSAKGADVSLYNAKCHSSTGQVTVVSCSDWTKDHHIISARFSYSLLYISFGLCFLAVWWFKLLHY